MIKRIKSLIIGMLLTTGLVANSTDDIQIYTTDNSKGKITGASIEKAFEEAGFVISGNNDMNIAFNGKFKQTHQKMLHLFTLYKADLVLELVKISPKAALFAPLSMSFYMNNGSNDISVSSLSIDGMAKITGIPANNKHMQAYSTLIKNTLAKALPNGYFEKMKYKPAKVTGDLVTTFTFEMEETEAEAMQEELEGVQEELEGSIETYGFVIAGFNNLADEFKEVGYDKYDFFDAYSICKLAVIFQIAKKHPEAGALAPCTFYMYKEKDSSMVTMEFPSVNNWISSLAIVDKDSLKVLDAAQKRIISVVNETIE